MEKFKVFAQEFLEEININNKNRFRGISGSKVEHLKNIQSNFYDILEAFESGNSPKESAKDLINQCLGVDNYNTD